MESKKWKLEVAKPAIVNTVPKRKKIDKLLGWEALEKLNEQIKVVSKSSVVFPSMSPKQGYQIYCDEMVPLIHFSVVLHVL